MLIGLLALALYGDLVGPFVVSILAWSESPEKTLSPVRGCWLQVPRAGRERNWDLGIYAVCFPCLGCDTLLSTMPHGSLYRGLQLLFLGK